MAQDVESAGRFSPAVSVIVPTFNRAEYVAEALDGMLAQVGPDDETIVVDDGSTDDTPEILARYETRIRVIRTPNGGLGAARNVGLAAARNEWIAFHDSDDVVWPDRLAVQRAVLRQHPDLDAVLCNGERLDAPGTFVVPSAIARRHADHPVGVRALFDGFPLYFQGALVRRRAFELAGPFDPTLRVHTDLDYGYRLLWVARTRFVNHPVFSYRWHGGNITADRIAGREELARILDRLASDAPAVMAAIGRRRVRARLARHYFRLAHSLGMQGRADAAWAAVGRARTLRPFDLRYRLLRPGRVAPSVTPAA